MAYNPLRDVALYPTIHPGIAGLTGQAVDLSNIVGPVGVYVVAGPGVAGPIEITVECAPRDAVDPCIPGVFAPVNAGGLCEPAAAFKITIDPTVDPYLTAGQMMCLDFLQCPCAFARAVASAAGPVTVFFGGKAARLAQV